MANIGIQSCLIRRDCLNQVGVFDETLPAFEDMELFVRIFRQYGVKHITKPLVRYYESTGGVSSDKRKRIQARKKIMSLHRKFLKNENEFLAREYQYYSLCHIDEYIKYNMLSGICFFFFYRHNEIFITLSAVIQNKSKGKAPG